MSGRCDGFTEHERVLSAGDQDMRASGAN